MRRKFSHHFRKLCALIFLSCVGTSLCAQVSENKNAKTLTCLAAGSEVQGSTNKLPQQCPGEPVNLSSVILNTPPDGCILRWYTDDVQKTPDKLYATPESAQPGKYYPVFYDTLNQCFGIGNPYLNFVHVEAIKQVYLTRTTLHNLFGVTTGDLGRTVYNPADSKLQWYTNPYHEGAPVADPSAVADGEYWAFLKFDNCAIPFNTDSSTAKVTMIFKPTGDCRAEKTGMMLNYSESTDINLICPNDKADLNTKLALPVPDGCEMRWYTNSEHIGTPYPIHDDAAPGKYYPFFYDPSNDCYSSEWELYHVTVRRPKLTPYNDTLYTEYQETTVDLGKADGDYYGYNIVWYDNPTHSGSPVQDVHAVSAGKYYPFVQGNGCFNTDSTDIFVTVLYAPVDPVKLKIKVMLQGAMAENEPMMRSDLQNLHQLPHYTPYDYEFWTGSADGHRFYWEINNPAGSAGEVVDWIRIYLFKVGEFKDPLVTRDLLVRPDGYLVDSAGATPWFYPSAEPVYLVINHRNHMEIVSTPINNFASGDFEYDFTTSLAQASSVPGQPDQMILRNGVWCMWTGDQWVGDLPEHSRINSQDYQRVLQQFNGSFHGYANEDLNMDGFFDVTDVNLSYYSSLVGPVSFFTHPTW